MCGRRPGRPGSCCCSSERRRLDHPNLVPDELPTIAYSPLVIAMPRPMAEALGWPDAELGWSDLFDLAQDPDGWGAYGHPDWGAFKLGKTNPNYSTSGLNSLVGTYFAATGLSSDLSLQKIEEPKVQEFVGGVESAVVHYGDISLTFLSNLQRADDQGRGSVLRLRGGRRREVGLGLQPGQSDRRPRDPRRSREAQGAPGRDLSR